MSTEKIPPAEIAAGTKDEHAEHHMPLPIAKRTALDHLREFPHYYSDLAKAEPKFRKVATEEMQKRAVFRDLANKEDHKPGKDILADREASPSFRRHEDKHVRGTEGLQYVCFPDAAAHAGLAYLAWQGKGDLRSKLPPDYQKEVEGLLVDKLPARGSQPPMDRHSFDFQDLRVHVGMDQDSSLVVTVHADKPFKMISPRLAAFARQTIRQVFGAAAATKLEAIRAPDLRPPPGFKSKINRSK